MSTTDTSVPVQSALTEDQISDLILQNDRAYQVWLDGYLRGLIHGANNQRLTNAQQAELAARRFYALETHEIDHRRFCKQAVESVDIVAARKESGTYIPRKQA